MHPNLAILLFILTLIAAPWASAQAQEAAAYEIRLHRPAKVGTKTSLTFSGELSQERTLVVNGERRKQPSLRIGLKLNGVLEILRVDERGREMAVKCTVEEGTVLQDGKEVEKLAKGSVLIAEAGEKETEIKLEKGELSLLAKAALQVAFSLKKGAGPNDNELYGTPEKQTVGGSWPVNAELLAKELSQQGLSVRKEHVNGNITLTSIEKIGDEPMMNLLIALEVHGFPSPVVEGLPPGFKSGPGSVKTKLKAGYPLDPAKQRRLESENTTIFLLNGGPGGVLLETDLRKVREARYTPLP